MVGCITPPESSGRTARLLSYTGGPARLTPAERPRAPRPRLFVVLLYAAIIAVLFGIPEYTDCMIRVMLQRQGEEVDG